MSKQDSLTATAGGLGAYLKELKREEQDALAPLRHELKSLCDPVRKGEIRRLIKAVKLEFAKKRKSARRSLFFDAPGAPARSASGNVENHGG